MSARSSQEDAEDAAALTRRTYEDVWKRYRASHKRMQTTATLIARSRERVDTAHKMIGQYGLRGLYGRPEQT